MKKDIKTNHLRNVMNILKDQFLVRVSFFHYLNLFFVLGSLLVPFLFGKYTSDVKIETNAQYIANRAKDSTFDSKTLGVTFSSDDGVSGTSDESEFYNLYGVFGKRCVMYGSGFNINKDHNITVEQFESENNLSIFYTGVDSSKPYGNHYQHWYYPFELMFETERMYDISPYMIYLSQTQADEILDNQNAESKKTKYEVSDYQTLIKTILPIKIDGDTYDCVICNIYYETGEYYNTFQQLLGKYLLCAYYCPGKLQRQTVYVFKNDAFKNKFLISYLNNVYSPNNYKVNVIEHNIISKIDSKQILYFYGNDFGNDTGIFEALICLSALLLSVSAVVVFYKGTSLLYWLLYLVILLAPYILFGIIFLLTSSTLYFSNCSILSYVCLVLYSCVLTIILLLVNKHVRKEVKVINV